MKTNLMVELISQNMDLCLELGIDLMEKEALDKVIEFSKKQVESIAAITGNKYNLREVTNEEIEKIKPPAYDSYLTMPKCTRVEVIQHSVGRVYTNYGCSNVHFSVQDDKRTLKIFLDGKEK